jgi:hypothetical protein
MNLRRLYQKSFFLPLAIGFTYFCLFLETIKYPGFIGNHFFIDAKVYFTAVIVLLLFTDTESKIMRFILRANSLFLIAISLVYTGFSLLEGAHFRNYVLATFRFHLDGLILPVLFSLALFLAGKFKSELPKVGKRSRIIYIVFTSLLVFFVVKNITYDSVIAFSWNSYVAFHLKSSYDDKMFYQWGDFYRFMTFVKKNTPSDATIVIPPEQDPWLIGSGNNDFVRAFIYPRKIVQETLIIPDLKVFGPNTYILITWGKEACKPDPGCHGWPRQDLKAKKIIYKDPDSANVIETKENAVYRLQDDKYVYGLIEL